MFLAVFRVFCVFRFFGVCFGVFWGVLGRFVGCFGVFRVRFGLGVFWGFSVGALGVLGCFVFFWCVGGVWELFFSVVGGGVFDLFEGCLGVLGVVGEVSFVWVFFCVFWSFSGVFGGLFFFGLTT